MNISPIVFLNIFLLGTKITKNNYNNKLPIIYKNYHTQNNKMLTNHPIFIRTKNNVQL
jgi:hypothetical protein